MHTVFGHVTEGQDVVDAIEGGDSIEGIEIHDSTDALFEAQSARIEEWNRKLGKLDSRRWLIIGILSAGLMTLSKARGRALLCKVSGLRFLRLMESFLH